MSFTVKLADGSSVDYPDSANYRFDPHGILRVWVRCPGRRYDYTARYFAPLRWTEVVATHFHGPGAHRDRDKWLGGIGTVTLLSYREEDDPEFIPHGKSTPARV